MGKRDIIVIGASSGGFEVLKKLIGELPSDLMASIFVVWHISPDVMGVLPQALNRAGKIHAAHGVDGEPVKAGRIYVAPPDHHLLVECDHVRVTRGPKENRFRPAVDPLFRSAAYAYNNRVIGVVLSGALDDGTSGLWMIKHRGGVAVVQDPLDAEFTSMPRSALREVAVDYVVPVSEMANLLVHLTQEKIKIPETAAMERNEQTELEIKVAMEDSAFDQGIIEFGELTPYTCPDCHGVLVRLKDGTRGRYRCHTGHAFSPDSLLATVTEKVEDSLYSAIRGIEESILLLNQMGKHYAENNQIGAATVYFKKAFEAEEQIKILRATVLNHEHLSGDSLREQANDSVDDAKNCKMEH